MINQDDLCFSIEIEMDVLKDELDEIFEKYRQKIVQAYWEPKIVPRNYFQKKDEYEGIAFIHHIIDHSIKSNNLTFAKSGHDYMEMVYQVLRQVYFDNLTEGFGEALYGGHQRWLREHSDNKMHRTYAALSLIIHKQFTFNQLLSAYEDNCCELYR